MCASLPDLQRPPEPKSKPFESSPVVTAESKPLEASPETMTESKHVEPSIVNVAKPKNVVKEPIHVVRKRWFMQKRLKKVHLETLEKVYSRTKRPTVSELFLLVCTLDGVVVYRAIVFHIFTLCNPFLNGNFLFAKILLSFGCRLVLGKKESAGWGNLHLSSLPI